MMQLKQKLKEVTAKLSFWWAKKILKEGRDFAYGETPLNRQDSSEEPVRIVLLRGKFKGTIFSFRDITLKYDDEGLLEFRTEVENNPSGVPLLLNKKFEKTTSNILRILLSERVRCVDKKGLVDEYRKNDTAEFGEEREFHEESNPLLEKRVSERKLRKKGISRDTGIHPKVQPTTKSSSTKTRASRKNQPNRKRV